MFLVGELGATINADRGPFNKVLDSVFRDGGAQMRQLGKTMTGAITLPLLGAGALALKTAADYETLRMSMDILNGSAEEGARNFERLKEFSARTPFQLQDLASAQNMLQGFGQTADDAFESIKMIGDISAVSGGSIEGIGIAFGQAAAEGKLMSRDIRQLINQGVPAIKLLADTMGVAESEIFDLASQGEISFDILNRSFKEATSEGGMFADGMKKQATTLKGVWSTLKDNASIALGEIGSTISEELDIKDIIHSLTESIQTGVKWFGSLSSGSKKLAINIALVSAAAGPLVWVMGSWTRALGSILAILPKVTMAQLGLNTAMKANVFLAVAGAVTALTIKLGFLNRAAKDFKTTIQDALNIDTTGTDAELLQVTEAIARIGQEVASFKEMELDPFSDKATKGTARRRIEALNEEALALVKVRDEILSKQQASRQAADSVVSDSAAIATSFDGIVPSIAAIKPVDHIITPEAFGQIDSFKTALTDMQNWQPPNFGELLFPPGSLGALQERLAAFREELLYATDPENIAGLQNKINELKERIAELTGETVNFGEATNLTSDAVKTAFQGMSDDSISSFTELGRVVTNTTRKIVAAEIAAGIATTVKKALSEVPFPFNIAAAAAAGASAAGLFNAIVPKFHSGGIVPGSGETMALLEGGEGVFTQSQMRALGGANFTGNMATNRPPALSEQGVFRAVTNALSTHTSKLGPDEVFALTQKGRAGY